jgi:hypothetical protein
MDNQRKFLDTTANKLGFKNLEDWYQISNFQIIENGGRRLLDIHGSSSSLVKAVYCHHLWNQYNFNTVPGYWDNQQNQRAFLDNLGQQLGFKCSRTGIVSLLNRL